MMSTEDARNWVGKRYLVLTTTFFLYNLLFAETMLFPIEKSHGNDISLIVIPFLLAQVCMTFQWYSAEMNTEELKISRSFPAWLIKYPFYLGIITLILPAACLIFQNNFEKDIGISSMTIKHTSAFFVSFMSVSHAILFTKLFRITRTQA